MEKWLVVEDFTSYEVSDEGRIRNRRNRQILKPLDNRRGTMMVILRRDGQGYSRAVRKLVLQAFDPIGHHDAVAIHRDNDYTNTRLDNLEWRSRSQAQERSRQNRRTETIRSGRIRDAYSGEEWDDALVAAKELDLLERNILTSAFNGTSYKGRYFCFI